MAKKKQRELIKLNNKIRNYFGGEAFEDGVAKLDEDRLIELVMLLSIPLDEYSRSQMVRALRRLWSEGGVKVRRSIVSYLTKPYRAVHEGVYQTDMDRVGNILYLLSQLPHTPQEESIILEQFIDMAPSKITLSKIENKLTYLRLKEKLLALEARLDVTFTYNNAMEFYHPFLFELHHHDFHKSLLCQSEPIAHEIIHLSDQEEKITKLQDLKSATIEAKTQEINRFLLQALHTPHPYLTPKQIEEALKAMPIDLPIDHTPLPKELLDTLLCFPNQSSMTLSKEQITITTEEEYLLYDTPIAYQLLYHFDNASLYPKIWYGEPLDSEQHYQQIKEETTRRFEEELSTFKEECYALSEGLEGIEELIKTSLLCLLLPDITARATLTIKPKMKRALLFHFQEAIEPLREQQRKEELLAQSIRDFKQLFPLARGLKRSITFHVGPTNSGKTYDALKQLKEAQTGYYLAPLRLLALEGYEKLKEENIAVSLITGEEEILDEDSTHISSTIEMMNPSVDVEVAVIDEIQMISDRDRGWAWANALIGVPASRIILTGSIDALLAIEALCDYLGEPLEVKHFERKSPLKLLTHTLPLPKITPQTAIVAFSRREVLALRQQLSPHFTTSVIYGNLSPEVRREEAKRFRERQSQILIATDAIAMGLNLPIKTLLFAKVEKFDGLRRRELLPQEVLQIAGRAGRYGIEEEGYIGALEPSDLQRIERLFYSSIAPIALPVSVMASLDHVLLIGDILHTEQISTILSFFADNMEFEGPFRAANIDAMLEIASIVDQYNLDLKSRYFLSCAPVTINSPYIESIFHRYIKDLEDQKEVRYIPPRDLPPFAQTNEMLLNAEDRVREISLYLWLSFKFPNHFTQTQKALDARARLNHYIENSLQNISFTKACRECQKVLDFSYRFSICERCYGKKRRGYRTKESRRRSSTRRRR
jgi:ATP-dependent RNA helicase SUPV3L1/SUV3